MISCPHLGQCTAWAEFPVAGRAGRRVQGRGRVIGRAITAGRGGGFGLDVRGRGLGLEVVGGLFDGGRVALIRGRAKAWATSLPLCSQARVITVLGTPCWASDRAKSRLVRLVLRQMMSGEMVMQTPMMIEIMQTTIQIMPRPAMLSLLFAAPPSTPLGQNQQKLLSYIPARHPRTLSGLTGIV